MRYNILAVADIHWGAIDAETLYTHLYSILFTITQLNQKLDLIVICGDYFDYRLSLNSKAALLSIRWMHELYQCAKKNGVKAIRVIRGTEDHDNNQLEAFKELEDENNFFKIIRKNTVEETLPNLQCLYCPDENINWSDYEKLYMENLMKIADIGFFHGSFDIVLPDIVVQLSEETSAKSVVFNFNVLSGLIKGPLIAGHWHDAFDKEPLHYIGSFEAWEHGEDNPKGFALINYDTTDNSYIYYKVKNPLVREFRTILSNTMQFTCAEDYMRLIDQVKQIKSENPNVMLRLLFLITTEDPKIQDYLASLKLTFINDRTIKVVIKDLVKKKKKEREKKEVNENSTKYAFIFDKSVKIPQKIQEFALLKKDKEIPLDTIAKYIDKYLLDE